MQIKAVALAVLLGLAAEAAQAQPRLVSDVLYGGISPAEAVDIVRSTGLRPVARPQREGPYYIVHALDSYGDTKRVVIDAEMGDVLRVRPIRGYVRSAPWYGRTPPEFGGGPRLWRGEADRMGPPPGAVGRSWRAPPPRYGAYDDDDDDLPPSRTVARPPMQGPPPSASLPPPPDPVQRAPAAAAVSPGARTATVAPVAKPPLPRERPNREAARPAAANPQAAVTAPEPPKSAPRVVLPGGPPARDEAKGETTASVPAAKSAAASEPAKTPPAKPPAAAMPPVNPLE